VVFDNGGVAALEKLALLAALKECESDNEVVSEDAWVEMAHFLVGSVKMKKNF